MLAYEIFQTPQPSYSTCKLLPSSQPSPSLTPTGLSWPYFQFLQPPTTHPHPGKFNLANSITERLYSTYIIKHGLLATPVRPQLEVKGSICSIGSIGSIGTIGSIGSMIQLVQLVQELNLYKGSITSVGV